VLNGEKIQVLLSRAEKSNAIDKSYVTMDVEATAWSLKGRSAQSGVSRAPAGSMFQTARRK
jgi:hypothetical protein